MDKLLDAFRRILIPVDFSEESKRALETCSQLFANQHEIGNDMKACSSDRSPRMWSATQDVRCLS